MPKPKSFLKQSKPKRKIEPSLETADDFLAAGVDHEDAAGKWRAGDATKSMRFFTRAIEVYEEGLRKFPQSLDLAYNKARVQFEIATHPILVRQLQVPLFSLLETTLASHRYALNLDPENADSLFNTSQVLTSIAEQIINNSSAPDAVALPLLEEALEMQDRCLAFQELKLEESKQQERDASKLLTEPDPSDDPSQPFSEVARQGDQWASVVEPVTADTLIDTILAQLGTLTTLCSAVGFSSGGSSAASLQWVEEFSTKLLQDKLPTYTENQAERLQEVALVKANLVSALLEAGFRLGNIDVSTYKRERDAAFAVAELVTEGFGSALMANACSLMCLNSAISETSNSDTSSTGVIRWNTISAAITSLAKAAKATGMTTEDLPRTHILRGDCSLLQAQLGRPPTFYQPAITNAPQLLKNAEVFYRNAAKLSQEREEQDTARMRADVVWGMQKNEVEQAVVSAVNSRDQQWKLGQLEEMIDEGLLPNDFLLSLSTTGVKLGF